MTRSSGTPTDAHGQGRDRERDKQLARLDKSRQRTVAHLDRLSGCWHAMWANRWAPRHVPEQVNVASKGLKSRPLWDGPTDLQRSYLEAWDLLGKVRDHCHRLGIRTGWATPTSRNERAELPNPDVARAATDRVSEAVDSIDVWALADAEWGLIGSMEEWARQAIGQVPEALRGEGPRGGRRCKFFPSCTEVAESGKATCHRCRYARKKAS